MVSTTASTTGDPATRLGLPRIAPLPEQERDPEAKKLLDGTRIDGAPAANVFATMVRHPALFRRLAGYGGQLLGGELPARDRELLTLRTAWRCRAEYEWAQHVPLARIAGLTDQEIQRVRRTPADAGWEPADAVLIEAADELHDDACLSDRSWEALASRYQHRQLIEVPMLVGHFHAMAYALNSLGVQLEPEAEGFTP